MAVNIENVSLNILVSGDYDGEHIEKPFTLLRVLFSNLWERRIQINKYNDIKLIDSAGMQHGHEHYKYSNIQGCHVAIADNRRAPYEFENSARELEALAKTRGWLWFPALPKRIYPHRLICKFWMFAPGSKFQDLETLEIAFNPKSIDFLHNRPGFDIPQLTDGS